MVSVVKSDFFSQSTREKPDKNSAYEWEKMFQKPEKVVNITNNIVDGGLISCSEKIRGGVF